jgi:hypothetical protein
MRVQYVDLLILIHSTLLFNLQTFGNIYSRLSNPTTGTPTVLYTVLLLYSILYSYCTLYCTLLYSRYCTPTVLTILYSYCTHYTVLPIVESHDSGAHTVYTVHTLHCTHCTYCTHYALYPTTAVLEERIATLEGGRGATCTASGE